MSAGCFRRATVHLISLGPCSLSAFRISPFSTEVLSETFGLTPFWPTGAEIRPTQFSTYCSPYGFQ